MRFGVLGFLYGSVPITFVSDLPVERAVAQLREATTKSFFYALTREAAVGKVSEHKVSLYRSIPFVNNSFKPVFVGRFEVENGRTALRGEFTLHWIVKLFMTIWFGLLVLWTLMATLTVVTKPAAGWPLPLFGIGMLVAGAGLMRLGKWFARNDSRYLTELIAKALAQPAASA